MEEKKSYKSWPISDAFWEAIKEITRNGAESLGKSTSESPEEEGNRC